jgi:hypothetical protein
MEKAYYDFVEIVFYLCVFECKSVCVCGRDTKDRLLACNITCNGMIQKENSL